MESHTSVSAPAMAAEDDGPSLSPLQRAVAVYTKPGSAWTGLKRKSQWLFPMLVVLLLSTGITAALYQRAVVPMVREGWDDAISAGRMTAQQAESAEAMMSGPVGMVVSLVPQFIMLAVMVLFSALIVWFGVGFILGKKFRYRLALEVVAWSGLITIPSQLLMAGLAWKAETMKGIHTGFGILIPDSDPPNKVMNAVGFLLDAIGPLSIWYLAVVIIGAAAVSGAPRKPTAWVIGGLYLGLMVLFACVGAMMPGG